LRPHFAAEEQLLFPLVDRHVPAVRPLTERLLTDHRTFERTTEELQSPDPTTLERVLTEYGERLERHIRLEDRELFPAIEAGVPQEALRKLKRDMDLRYAEGQTPNT
jgi:hemerythrin-like domain-containing protein